MFHLINKVIELPIERNYLYIQISQFQMGKQTMGTPLHNWINQTSSKLYRLQYPQVALVRNKHYDDINMEEFCMGFNAVVAIISYTVSKVVLVIFWFGI